MNFFRMDVYLLKPKTYKNKMSYIPELSVFTECQ